METIALYAKSSLAVVVVLIYVKRNLLNVKRTCKAQKSVQHVQKVRSYTLCTCVSRVLQKKEKRTATTARVEFATDAVAKAIDLFGFATKLSISYANRKDVDIFGFRFALTRNRNKG